MSKYNIFDDSISKENKDFLNEDLAQTKAILEASNLIINAMEEKGINQTELAEVIGVSRGYISRILSGNENMSIKNIARILYILGKNYVQLSSDKITPASDSNIYFFEEYNKNEIKMNLKAQYSDPDNTKLKLWESELKHG